MRYPVFMNQEMHSYLRFLYNKNFVVVVLLLHKLCKCPKIFLHKYKQQPFTHCCRVQPPTKASPGAVYDGLRFSRYLLLLKTYYKNLETRNIYYTCKEAFAFEL